MTAADPFALASPPKRTRPRTAAGARPRWRRATRWLLGLGIPLALTLVVTALLVPPTDNAPLSLRNPGPSGARAVAKVLGRHGVDVIAADTTAEAVAQATGQARLAIIGPEPVSDRQLDLYASVEVGIVLISPDPTLLAHLEATIGGERLVVMADAAVFTNQGVLEGDNAATALRVLGAEPRLIWNLAAWEGEGGQGDLWQLLPPWAKLAGAQLLIAAAAAALWRGRRMGRLVPDALPVTVPASQITVGLGGLYRRTRALGHAAAGLRAGAASRIGAALG
ncbi:MAG: DUF4350 domain-containing protein, partial [Bifidobacteriaceae bacterium]|nr:DUF4350 domain-containing protein [Bifidobacteriaceae bacterium]